MTFEILFKEPVKIEAETADEAMAKFAEMFERSMDMNDLFYADERDEIQRDKDELAEFFMDQFYDDIVDDDEDMTEDDIKNIAYRGVEYWYKGNVDGTQWDCLMLGRNDWRREHGY